MKKIDGDTLERLFADTRPGRGHKLIWYALIGAVGVGFLSSALPGGTAHPIRVLALVLPWGAMFVLLAMGWRSARRHRECRKRITAAWEYVQLDAPEQAKHSLERAFCHPIRAASDRCRAFMLLANLAEQDRSYEIAQQIYETLLLNRIGDGYQLQEAQLALTSAKLKNQELTDAVTLLNRLEKVAMPMALRAVFELIRLYQQVFMGQFDDAIEKISDRRDLFQRYLSTRAGYGYGLMAAALHFSDRGREASQLWLDATTLIPAEKLVREYECLTQVSERYPAMEYPL